MDVSRVGRRAVLYHRDRREALVLNPTGSWLWDQLAPGKTQDDLVTALQREHRLSSDQATRDVQQFLEDLRRHDAIVNA